MVKLFKQLAVGIDIADRSIEAAEIVRRGGKLKVLALGRQSLPVGVVERGVIKDKIKLAAALKLVLNLAKPKPILPERVYFGLPESQVYLHSFTLPKEGAKNLEELIRQQALEHVPLEAADLIFTYKLLGSESGGNRYLLAATSREVLTSWRDFFHDFGLEVKFDLETLAWHRSLGPLAARTVALVDFGAVATSVAVFDERGLRYTRTFAYGADALTQDLTRTLKMSAETAEKAKEDVGLVDSDSQIFTILLNGLIPLRDELKVTLDYYASLTGTAVEAVYLAGGGSELRGLADYLKSNLEVSVAVARSAFLNQTLVYLESLGLALKNFAPRSKQDELTFSLESPSFGTKVGNWFSGNRKFIWLALVFIIGGAALLWAIQYRQAADEAAKAALRAKLDAIPTISPEIIFPEPAATSTTATSTLPTVTIKDTPTGWLNVRSGPGTNFGAVTKVNPGEAYPLLSEEGDWVRIKLILEVEEIEGWVAKQYIIKN
ncbi:MAG: pilus assembly protein PilM [Patescibacteria group bacterium]